MPAIFRSYYDPLIIASVLRWVRPSEAWWGDGPNSATAVLEDLLIRARSLPPPVAAMLCAEVLLAVGLGKVPDSGRTVPIEEAHRLRDLDVGGGFLDVALELVGTRPQPGTAASDRADG